MRYSAFMQERFGYDRLDLVPLGIDVDHDLDTDPLMPGPIAFRAIFESSGRDAAQEAAFVAAFATECESARVGALVEQLATKVAR